MSRSTSTEPASGPRLTGRLAAPSVTAGAALALAAAVGVRDPHVAGAWGVCPILLATGHPCPACGGLRALADLLHGDVGAALGSNAYAVATVAALTAAWALWAGRLVRGEPSLRPAARRRVAPALVLWFLGLLAFGGLRLLPALSGLQP